MHRGRSIDIEVGSSMLKWTMSVVERRMHELDHDVLSRGLLRMPPLDHRHLLEGERITELSHLANGLADDSVASFYVRTQLLRNGNGGEVLGHLNENMKLMNEGLAESPANIGKCELGFAAFARNANGQAYLFDSTCAKLADVAAIDESFMAMKDRVLASH
jgi:hypothetical protein